jgi:hypothetical protein
MLCHWKCHLFRKKVFFFKLVVNCGVVSFFCFFFVLNLWLLVVNCGLFNDIMASRSRARTGNEPLEEKDHVWCWWIDPNSGQNSGQKSQSRYWSATISQITKDISGQIMYYGVHYADKSR